MSVNFSANIRDMEPIQTEYKGYWFRSRLEARWAVFFDRTGVDWSYEVQGFNLTNQEESLLYLPDFYIQSMHTPWENDTEVWVEVKGVMKKKDEEKCRRLAIESECPVLLVQGDPVEENITLYRKHTPLQEVKLAIRSDGLHIIKGRLSDPSTKLVKAQEAARRKRFEN